MAAKYLRNAGLVVLQIAIDNLKAWWFDWGMAEFEKPRIMQMRMTPAEVGKACALFLAARCGAKLPNGAKVRMDYYFDRNGKAFSGARARVEAL
jgi:hypothetical protein